MIDIVNGDVVLMGIKEGSEKYNKKTFVKIIHVQSIWAPTDKTISSGFWLNHGRDDNIDRHMMIKNYGQVPFCAKCIIDMFPEDFI